MVEILFHFFQVIIWCKTNNNKDHQQPNSDSNSNTTVLEGHHGCGNDDNDEQMMIQHVSEDSEWTNPNPTHCGI